MSLLLNVLKDKIAIVKKATEEENGLRIRQPVVREERSERIDFRSFLVEEFTVSNNIVNTVKVNSGDLNQFISALKELKGDKRNKQIVRVELVK